VARLVLPAATREIRAVAAWPWITGTLSRGYQMIDAPVAECGLHGRAAEGVLARDHARLVAP
jgi:hypothetical protein